MNLPSSQIAFWPVWRPSGFPQPLWTPVVENRPIYRNPSRKFAISVLKSESRLRRSSTFRME